MFTIRNIGGVALFLAGTTWLWMTPGFSSRGVSTDGFWWAATRVACLLTIVAFTVATWGLFARHDWLKPVALGSTALGLLGVLLFWVAASGGGENAGAVT